MKTPKEIYSDLCEKHIDTMDRTDIVEMAMVEFAKLHVTAALEAAAHEATTKSIPFTDDEEVDRDSILTAYPLEKVK